MSTRTDEARELGIAIGRREVTERMLQFLQAQLTIWEGQDGKAPTFSGKIGAHFRAGLNSVWTARIRAVVAALERDLISLRGDEALKRQAFEQRKGLRKWL